MSPTQDLQVAGERNGMSPGAENSWGLRVAACENVLVDGFNVNSQIPAYSNRSDGAAFASSPNCLRVYAKFVRDLAGGCVFLFHFIPLVIYGYSATELYIHTIFSSRHSRCRRHLEFPAASPTRKLVNLLISHRLSVVRNLDPRHVQTKFLRCRIIRHDEP